jgi:energy-coupling factor transporter ATP-binding protein EcfA2
MPAIPHSFRIRKIRMINFHNFTNETITVNNGGHLFLLGDNGSGKTTVLDAVHYVLDPSKSMEFNSAARVAGSRKDSGRRVQGIVMRYNTGPGTLSPGGGVSYAAIELEDSRGKSLTLAIGLSCSSMDENIQRWGIIRSGTLEDIPFLTEELEGTRPRNKREMKTALDGKGFYGQINSYCRDLAARLFGDEATYAEVCKFISTGKAYREIVSRTADYHQLFRALLQEPNPEVFEKVIDHLKTLDNSRQDLENMEGRLAFLTELNALRDDVDGLRARQAALGWLAHALRLKQLWSQHADTSERAEAEKGRLQGLEATIEKTELTLEELRQRIHEFQNKDQEGLVAREQELERSVKGAVQQLQQLERDWEMLRRDLAEQDRKLGKQRKQLIKEIRQRFTAVHRAADGLSVSAQPVLNALDSATSAEYPEQKLTTLNEQSVREEADELLMEAQQKKQEQQHQLDQISENIQSLETQLEEKRKQGEAEPRIEGFSAAKRQFAEKMYKTNPLYTGLEPNPGISRKELSVLEQLIGEEILGTWLTQPGEENPVRRLLFTQFPEQTLAVVEPDANDTLADWIRHWFDTSTSDPFALIALHREMCAASGPVTEKLSDFESLRFRARQQKVRGNPVRLIGAEARRKQMEQEIKALETELKNLVSEQKKAASAQNKTIVHMEALQAFKAALDFHGLRSAAQDTASTAQQQQLLSNQENGLQEQCMIAEEAHAMAHEKLEDIRLHIESAGLHDLEKRINAMKKKLRSREKEQRGNLKETGSLQREISQAEKFVAGLVLSIQTSFEQQKEMEEALHAFGEFEDPTMFAATLVNTELYGEANQAEAELLILQNESLEKEVLLREKAAGPEGISFAFVYDKEANSLIDRRSVPAKQVLEDLDRNYREQQEIITEETRRLFEQFIMHDLLTALRDRVSRLMDMSRKINRMLKDREFGNLRYSFNAKPLDQYKRLINLIRTYSELSPTDPALELKEFIEEHQDEILNTEPGDMPELLDYRNWFHFELQVKPGAGTEVVMDRKNKSIGSGGEQAVPNYLLVLTIAHFLYDVPAVKLPLLLFDEAFYGIDTQRRDQLLAFASDLGLQLFVASPDQDGVKKEIPYSTSLFVIKDAEYNIHLYDFQYTNPKTGIQQDLLNPEANEPQSLGFGEEL